MLKIFKKSIDKLCRELKSENRVKAFDSLESGFLSSNRVHSRTEDLWTKIINLEK